MDEDHAPSSIARMNLVAWGLLLFVAVLFVLGRESGYGGAVGVAAMGLAWLSTCYGVATIYLVLRSKSNVAYLLWATPVILIAGLFALVWTYDLVRMLLGYGD